MRRLFALLAVCFPVFAAANIIEFSNGPIDFQIDTEEFTIAFDPISVAPSNALSTNYSGYSETKQVNLPGTLPIQTVDYTANIEITSVVGLESIISPGTIELGTHNLNTLINGPVLTFDATGATSLLLSGGPIRLLGSWSISGGGETVSGDVDFGLFNSSGPNNRAFAEFTGVNVSGFPDSATLVGSYSLEPSFYFDSRETALTLYEGIVGGNFIDLRIQEGYASRTFDGIASAGISVAFATPIPASVLLLLSGLGSIPILRRYAPSSKT